jgi:hypothetical protein
VRSPLVFLVLLVALHALDHLRRLLPEEWRQVVGDILPPLY